MDDKKDQKLIEDIAFKLAISNFVGKEQKNMSREKRKIAKVAVIVTCLVAISATGVVFAKEIGGLIEHFFGSNTSDGVDKAAQNGYVVDAKTNYQQADGIEVKVDSMMMDDFNLAINFKIRVREDQNIDEFEHAELEDLMVVDETGQIVFNTHAPEIETEENRGKTYMGSYSFLPTKLGDQELKLSLSATGNPKPFPKSRTLQVHFSKIRSWSYQEGQKIDSMYQGNWNFEIDVPEEFYHRKTIVYQAKSCKGAEIPLETVQASLSQTALKLVIPEMKTDKVDYQLLKTDNPKSIFDKIAIQQEYVVANGKQYETAQRSDGDGGYGIPDGQERIVQYHQTFNLTSYDAADTITVHMKTNKGEEIVLELERAREE